MEPINPITRWRKGCLSDNTEVFEIFERTPVNGGAKSHSVVFPSRRIDPATPEVMREYARAWSEGADWLEKRLATLAENINRGEIS